MPKKSGRRLLSGLLALVLCLTLVPVIYADTVVSVESWHDAEDFEEKTLYWVDNNDEESERPAAEDYQPLLYFRIEGEDWRALEEDTCSDVGLSSVPQMTVVDNGNNTYTVSVPDHRLPAEIIREDEFGTESEPLAVEWALGPAGSGGEEETDYFGSYIPVEVNEDNVEDYPSAKDQLGWYYVLTDEFSFDVQLRQGDRTAADGITDALYQTFLFSVDTGYDTTTATYLLDTIREVLDVYSDVGADSGDPSGTITISGLWKYNLDGSRIEYSVEEAPNGDGRLDADDGILDSVLDAGDWFQISYDNSGAPNVGSEVDKVYDGGILYLTLTGTKDYSATKVWEDQADSSHRPDGELQLWRYRAGQSYTTAAPVRDNSGIVMTIPLDKQNTQEIAFGDLPKYDAEGYEYIYVVREYLTGDDAGRYTQVLGAVDANGDVSDTIWVLGSNGRLEKLTGSEADAERAENDTYLYNEGTLSNKLSGTVTVDATKIWKAAAFQSELTDVQVELTLQSRPKGSTDDDAWENTDIIKTLGGGENGSFSAENLGGLSVSESVPKYDNQGRELEYRWVESAVYENSSKVEMDDDSFTLTSGGSRGEARYQVTYQQNDNGMVITNAVSNRIDYTVEKVWEPDDQSNPKHEVTFALYRTIGEQSLTEDCKVLTFAMNEEGAFVKDSIEPGDAYIDEIDKEITISGENWDAFLNGLPEYDEEGRRYEYLILEEGGNPTYETTIDSETGDYTTIVTNGPGTGERILVQKNWVDDSDTAHREPVEVTVYDRNSGDPIKNGGENLTVTLGETQNREDPVWYEWVALPEGTSAEDVYIRETGIGAGGKVEPDEDADGSFRDKVTGENHAYEATYDSENVANEIVWTVTNRRLGNVDLTVVKDWRDGNGEGASALQTAMAGTGLTLAVKLEISASDGTYTIGEDYVYLGGENVFIQNDLGETVFSIQPILTEDEKIETIYFHNLPKYDTNGTVVRYTVEEVWLDQTGKEITLSAANYPEVYALWSTYTRSVEETSYDANDGALENDTQEITLTNTRTGVTDAVWYKEWHDVYMYEAGSRPDIYLDIYQTVHTSETETETQLIYPSYRWTDEGLLPPETEEPDAGGDAGGSEGEVSETPAEASGDTAQQYVWQALLEDLPKYDAYGFEIVYSAVERTNVNASEFDYAIAEYWWEGTRLGTRNEADTESEDAYTAHTTALTGQTEETEDYARYALNAGGTFVNRLDKPLTIEGRKLWTNLPAGYPAEDLPTVTFALYQRERGGAYDFAADPIATLTISDWSGPNNYTFQILYEGENIIDSSGVVQPETQDQQPLPKYTPEGRLYEYTLRETGITGTGGASLVDDESTDTDIPLFEMRQPSNTFQAENVYNSPTGSLSVKKILELPTDEEGDPIAYPAVRFHLYRTYTKNSGETSEQELVQTITWSSQEVREAYQEQGQATVETTLTFEGLAQYAPNGSKYVYQIEEDQDFLGGYETKCGPGDLEENEITGGGYIVGGLLPHQPEGEADATFWNRREDPQTEFVTLTGTKVWQDFDNAFGLRPDGPYVYVEKTNEWIPVIRLSVTRRAAAQEGQEAPNITETLEEGTDYTVTWTQEDDVTWTYQIWGIGDQDIEDPQYPAEPREPETPTDTQTDPAPTDPGVSEPPSTGENDQSETPTAAEGNDQTAGSEEKTTQPPESSLSAASLHSDPADAGGSGSEADTTPGDGSDITPDPTEDPETDPGEDSPAPAQTELEKWAPNGARWVYSVKEELNPALPDELKEQYKIYFNNQTAGQSSTDGDTITMSNLTNSLETSARFEKKWVGSDGQSITADYMGLGEMSVTFTLYVKAGEDGIWQPAEEYFENMDSGLYSQIFGEDYQFTQTLGNRHIYDSWTGTFQHLPRVVKVNDKIVELSYRVAETKLTYHNGRETVDVPITVTVEGDTFTYTVNDSLFTGVTGDYATSTSELTNQLATTSLKVQKVWANDRNNAYDTRPDTDEEGMTWETSFLIQRTTAATPAEEDWQAVQVTGDGNETQDLVVTLTGTDTDGTLQAPASMTIPGLPQKAPDGERYFYRAVELQPEYEVTDGEVDSESYVAFGGYYNDAYVTAYNYGPTVSGASDEEPAAETEGGFITKVTNTMSTTKVYALKKWQPVNETGAPVTLKLEYMTAPAAEGAEATWQEMASVKVTVDGTKDAFSPSKPYYEYEAWKAVWEDLPARMPGSYLGENGTTQYRVVEETSGSYVLVNSDTGEVLGEDGKTTYPEFQFTNKAITSLTVLKQWHTTADKIADSITVQLWRTTNKNLVGQTEGDVEQVTDETATLSAANNWKVVFDQLDKVNEQNEKYYYYAIEEGDSGSGIEVKYDHGEPDENTVAFTTTIINKGFTDITVTKTWQDDNDAQDLRPDTLKLTLYRKTAVTEQEKVDEVTLSAEHAQSGNSNVWTYTFQDLPDTDENGNLYTYWVEEEPVSGYTESRTDDLDLVNTLGDADTEVQIQGEKTWVGDDPAKRPASITVILLQNGTEVKRQEVRPNEDGKWTYDFGNWPVYDDSGRAYTYTVQEEPVDGYGTQVNGYDIVNGQGGLTVTKQVYSGDKTREFRFTVTLSDKTVNGTYGDMTFIDGVAEFTLKDGESKTAARLLPGIRYTVTEERVSGYGIRIEGSNPGTIPFGDTAEVLVINYDDTTPPPDPKPDPDPDPDPDPTPDPDPDPDPTPDPDETPDPDIPDTPDEPGTPDEPDTPEEPDDSVHTGDDAQLALYLTLLAASLAGAAAVIFLGRRGRKKE
ncbi:Cna B-type domain-containing protein [Oscillibacter valericigenes]|uniref:Cna B-type domain-containing protein n=1 Tax=Oscillibacter valericigenes TaxID=351091 RepID=UPI00195B348C|nr:Cna B-type domain-containing protein [Oscillibacter valericigenes]MBM6909399.1 Cna B-type domain-containing protein [Oscillibacter valericigenes]